MNVVFAKMALLRDRKTNDFQKEKFFDIEHDNRFYHVSVIEDKGKIIDLLILPDQKKTKKDLRKISVSWFNFGKWHDFAIDPVSVSVREYFTNRYRIDVR